MKKKLYAFPMKLHHIALIVSELERSLSFYQKLLGFKVTHKIFRQERNSWKVDLICEDIRLEMFTFPDAPKRPSYPEALGLRHLAFGVANLEEWHDRLKKEIQVEDIRLDPYSGKKFFFFPDPDDLPIEMYQL